MFPRLREELQVPNLLAKGDEGAEINSSSLSDKLMSVVLKLRTYAVAPAVLTAMTVHCRDANDVTL